ncbi:MAG: hypothetical protein LDL41_17610 [Coleofasciculus sp. S288]|nr:hypothetical protein [Coleofasciculus sp. S288]
MSETTKTNDKATQAKTQQTALAVAKEPKGLNLRPLPNNRPIASNVTEDMDEMLGYLD